MLFRADFLKSAFSLLGAAGVPTPTPGPKQMEAIPWDMCDQNPAISYDHPLAMKLRVLDGPDFDLMKYRGQAVWLNVFASWCGPCTSEIPNVVAAANEYYGRGLRVIGVNFRESDETVRAYRKKFDIPFPIAMSGDDGAIVEALEVGAESQIILPVSLFIAPNGYLYCYTKGSMSKEEIAYRVGHFLDDVTATPGPTPSSPAHSRRAGS